MPRGWGRDWFYGPPYALLQGTFRAKDARGVFAKPGLQREGGCILRRGMLIMIDQVRAIKTPRQISPVVRCDLNPRLLPLSQCQGPDFLIGLAAHPEWATSYTHVADVVSEDLQIVDAVMAEPLMTQNWGSINATVFADKAGMPFTLHSTEAKTFND